MATPPAHLASAKPPVRPFFPPPWTRATRPASRVRCGVATSETGSRRPYWDAAEAEIDALLVASLPMGPPPTVRDSVLHLVCSTPRTLAPVLCVAACELVGGQRDRAMGAASALRLVHSAHHAHRSLLGWTIPAGPGPAAVALNDGVLQVLMFDALLPLAFQLVAAEADAGGADPGRVLRVLTEMADAAGAQGMVEGRYEEILYRQSGEDGATEVDDSRLLERVCKKKEGKLYAIAAACGAILGGAGAEETERLRRCGMYVGMLHGFLDGGGAAGFAAEASCRERRDAVAGELRSLALSELEGFRGDKKKEAIAGLVDVRL